MVDAIKSISRKKLTVIWANKKKEEKKILRNAGFVKNRDYLKIFLKILAEPWKIVYYDKDAMVPYTAWQKDERLAGKKRYRK